MFRDLFRRLQAARLWLLLQFFSFPLLILIGIGWTRLSEKNLLDVVLSLILPLILFAALLILQSATLRRLLAPLTDFHASFLQATLVLLPAVVLVLLVGYLLGRYDDHISSWAALLNSKAPAAWRARTLTFEHLSFWMNGIEWLLRWVALPWLLIPFVTAAAERGWSLDWGAALRILFDWRWLLAVLLLALFGVALPGKFFSTTPRGTLSTQIWSVSLKLGAAYLFLFIGWVLVFAWSAVFLRRKETVSGAAPEEVPST